MSLCVVMMMIMMKMMIREEECFVMGGRISCFLEDVVARFSRKF